MPEDDLPELPMPVHPAATRWTLPNPAEAHALAANIRDVGLLNPIWVWHDPDLEEDVVLDGRSRFMACLIAGVEPVFARYEGDDPERFVLSQNSQRRHAKPSQRAMAAAATVTATEGRPKNSADMQSFKEVTAEQAAEDAGVATRLVSCCLYVLRNQPPAGADGFDLVHAITHGTITATAAAAEAKRYQDNVVAPAAQRIAKTITDKTLYRNILQADFPHLLDDDLDLEEDDDRDPQGEALLEVKVRTESAAASIRTLEQAVDGLSQAAKQIIGHSMNLVADGGPTYVGYAVAHGKDFPISDLEELRELIDGRVVQAIDLLIADMKGARA